MITDSYSWASSVFTIDGLPAIVIPIVIIPLLVLLVDARFIPLTFPLRLYSAQFQLLTKARTSPSGKVCYVRLTSTIATPAIPIPRYLAIRAFVAAL